MSDLRRTPLYDWHAARQARMVDFAGWSMPVQYDAIVAEHLATRTAAGLFDISHMGRLRFDGAGAGEFLEGMTTRNVANMKPGAIRYSLLTNDAGGILDDILVYRVPEGPSPWMMVVNAGNREKIVRWLADHGAGSGSVGMRDETMETAMIAVQGPAALEICRPICSSDLRR